MEQVRSKAGTKENLRDIIQAIRVLKDLESSGRQGKKQERAALARFTGFGAVARTAFPDPVTKEYAPGWEDLGLKLRELLTDEEYASAKATTFSAFYTSDLVINEMFRGLTRMGIEGGSRGLEPGCGIGNFIGSAPEGLDFIGVEQDSISGRIARMIHPGQDIRIEGFQDTSLPGGSVDFAVGNVPFAEIKLKLNGERHSLHDYFFLKSLDAVRPGGAVALVTSRYTLDKADSTVRELLAEQADFAGAIRLPSGAFGDQGTKVVTDIIFLRRKSPEQNQSPEWAGSQWLSASTTELEGGEVTLNNYFAANPHMVLGNMSMGQGMYNNQDLRVRSDGELAAALHAAIDGLPANICTERTEPLPRIPSRAAGIPASAQEGSLYVGEARAIMQVVGGEATPVMRGGKAVTVLGGKSGRRLKGLIELKERARAVLRSQQEGHPEEERETARASLRRGYARFHERFGPINRTTFSTREDGTLIRRMPNLQGFRGDPDVYLVMALEEYDERKGTARPAAIMSRDVVARAEPVTKVESARDGLLASLNQLGRVDVEYISALYGRDAETVLEELKGLIFFDPALGIYVPADEYLSGNVREKLRLAESSEEVTRDPRMQGNIEALAAVQPEDLLAEEIDVTLGTPWIPTKDVGQFLSEVLGVKQGVKVEYVQQEALWKVTASKGVRVSAASLSQYGTQDVDAIELAEQALNMRTPTVRRRVKGAPGEDDIYVVDQEATLAAREKQSELKERFSGWIFEDKDRKDRLVRFYNENFNNIRLREFDGSHLLFPGMSSAFQMRPHQKDAIWRSTSSGNTLLAHVVGAGKTFTMVAGGMEMKRTGLAQKPLYVVPNHMLEQFAREFLVLYPGANLLVASKQDLAKNRRQLLKSRIATGNWDGVIMTHSSFEKIAMSPEFQAKFISGQLEEYEELLTHVTDRSLSRNITKKIEKLKASRKEYLSEMAEGSGKDAGLYFDELGVDHIFVDEAHMFKNLETPTKMDRVAGIQTGGSNRAFDLLMKTRFLQSRTPGRGITFATGTPVSNSLGEMYTMMRYLAPDLLRERGIEHFDAWAASFGEVVNALEISPDGQSLRVNSRFAKFRNIPELLSMFRTFSDVRTKDMLDLPAPALKGGKAEIIAAPMTAYGHDIQETLVDRYEAVRSTKVDPRVDNALKIITDGRKLALDPRLLDSMIDDDPDSKVNQLVEKVYDIWERTRDDRSTQLIFSDLGVSETEWGFSVYGDVIAKLEARGIPAVEIVAIGEAGTDQKKEALFKSVRSGQVRILLGSTSKMGTGTNVQEKLVALHHLDPPWRPADIEQREGRILRQGNKNEEVEIYRYVTEGSFDAYMWQTLETKAKFIAQAMAGDAGVRRASDIGGAELSFAEVKAIASGSPAMLVLAEMDLEIRQLTLLRKAHLRDQARIHAELEVLPGHLERLDSDILALGADTARRLETRGDAFAMQVETREFRKEPGEKKTARQRAQDGLALAVAQAAGESGPVPRHHKLGQIGGFDIVLRVDHMDGKAGQLSSHSNPGGQLFSLTLDGESSYHVARIENPRKCPALIHPLEHTLKSLDGKLARAKAEHEKLATDLQSYQERSGAPFASEADYQQLVPLRDNLKALLSRPEQADPEKIRLIIDVYRGLSLSEEQEAIEQAVELSQTRAASLAEESDSSAADEHDHVLTQELRFEAADLDGSEKNSTAEKGEEAELPNSELRNNQALEGSPERAEIQTWQDGDIPEASPVMEQSSSSDETTMTQMPHSQGQMSLFGSGSSQPEAGHRVKPTTRVVQPISAKPVQLGLFGQPPQSESSSTNVNSILAEGSNLAALGVHTEKTEVEARALPPAAFELSGQTSADDIRIGSDPEEVTHWRESLTAGDETDMEDMLENGDYAGAPEPTEHAVVGRFTSMVGEKPKLADIIHDAMEHYEPFGSMVERIEQETGRDKRRISPAELRGAKSLYNATLARNSDWER